MNSSELSYARNSAHIFFIRHTVFMKCHTTHRSKASSSTGRQHRINDRKLSDLYTPRSCKHTISYPDSKFICIDERSEVELSENPRKRNYLNLKNPVKTAFTQTSPVSPLPKTRIESGPPPLISLAKRQDKMDPMQVSVSRPSVITSTKVITRQPVHYMEQQVFNTQRMSTTAGLHRREIVETTMVDPFVEEHFRRSLGSDYKHVSPSVKTVAGSVDDHFAKALGETWAQINGGNTTTMTTKSNTVHSLVSPAN